MNNAKLYLVFICGAGVGAGITYKLLNSKIEKKYRDKFKSEYESRIEHDIVNIKEELNKKYTKNENDVTEKTENNSKESRNELDIVQKIAKDNGYTDYSEIAKNGVKKKKEDPVWDAEIVDDVEFSNNVENYDIISLHYYTNGVITSDKDDDPIINPIDYIGIDISQEAEDTSTDVLYIRNDSRKVYYEIFLEFEEYSMEV